MGDQGALDVIQNQPEEIKSALMHLRAMIFDVAETSDEIGNIVETLKWGQPSYLTEKPKTGTTLRIDRDTSGKGDVALYVNCQTSLVSEWRGMFPEETFGGDRSLHLSLTKPTPTSSLRQMVLMALTYHSRKKISR